jgi:hypothetical protein
VRIHSTLARPQSFGSRRLSLGLYTHVEMHDQTAAIEALPGPPSGSQRAAAIAKEKSLA